MFCSFHLTDIQPSIVSFLLSKAWKLFPLVCCIKFMWRILISVRTAESRVQCTCRFSCAGSFHHHQVFPRSVDVFDTPCWTACEGSLFSSYCSSNNTSQQETRNPSQMPTGFLVLSLYSFADPHFIPLHNGNSKGSCLKEHPVGWSCHCYSEE